MLKHEKGNNTMRGCENCVTFGSGNAITIQNPRDQRTTWEFDKVFKPCSRTEDVFKEIKGLVSSVIDGHNVSIFAFGPLGTGKTHTMEQITPQAVRMLFATKKRREETKEFEISLAMSLMGIYDGKMRDLMDCKENFWAKETVKVRRGRVEGLTVHDARDEKQMMDHYSLGLKNFSVSATRYGGLPRGHRVLCLYATCRNKLAGTTLRGKLYLVDLGNSNLFFGRIQLKHRSGEVVARERAMAKSLTSLSEVLHAWLKRQKFVPYRNSKLTHVLRDALTGDCKSVLIAHISPVYSCCCFVFISVLCMYPKSVLIAHISPVYSCFCFVCLLRVCIYVYEIYVYIHVSQECFDCTHQPGIFLLLLCFFIACAYMCMYVCKRGCVQDGRWGRVQAVWACDKGIQIIQIIQIIGHCTIMIVSDPTGRPK